MCWKKWLLAVVVIFGLYVGYRFYDQQFRLGNIQANWPVEVSATPISVDDQKLLDQVFSQPFRYLDRGKQSYVFVSEDGKYVLKFFDARCLQSGPTPLIAPISAKRCARKGRRLIIGYQVALEHDRDNTGLIFVQLVPDPSYSLKIAVTDRFGIRHDVNLAQVPFAVQLKAIPTRKVISELLENGDVAQAQERLNQIVDMYISEYRRGVIDLDHNVMYNTGFVDGRPIRIDVGRLKYDEQVKTPEVYQKDLEKVAVGRVSEWLGRHFPQYQKQVVNGISLVR